jgi:glutathione peroxidase-family protein/Tfp pilus assembly protein PilX
MGSSRRERAQRGTILLVVVFIATAIAGLALLGSSRVVTESRYHKVLEDESQAYNDAFAQIHLAMNVVNTSAYDDTNQNLALRDAIAGRFGGTASDVYATSTQTTTQGNGNKTATGTTAPATEPTSPESWLDDPEGVVHGFIENTNVRVYRARDYIKRLEQLRGDEVTDVDPFGNSDRYFVLEAAGRSGDTVRLVSALVRETQPFSSYVFFQNNHTLGVSGAPLGMIHTNADLAFYFAGGNYQDPVSAVNGFDYRGGATPDNTTIMDGNPDAAPISLDKVDFDDLKSKANLYTGQPGLDAEVLFFNKGEVRIKPYTKPRWDTVTQTYTTKVLVGYTTQTTQQWQDVQVGTEQVAMTRQVLDHYETQTTKVKQTIYKTVTETYTVQVPVYETQPVTTTTQVPVYGTHMVTKTRQVKVFVPYDTSGDTGSGTTIGDSGGGVLGEYQWVTEEYQVEETYITGYTTQTTTTMQQVQVGTTTETRTRDVQVEDGWQWVDQTTQVPVYRTETYYVTQPVYEKQQVDVTTTVPVYDNVETSKTNTVYQPAVPLGYDMLWVSEDTGGLIYIDGRILSVEGDLKGRLTLVSTDQVRITGDIRYIDESGDTAMLNGSDPTSPYVRNPDYDGNSVLGIIAKDDILFTWEMANDSEINATLLSVDGRVGADALLLDSNGDAYPDTTSNRKKYMTDEERTLQDLYDRGSFTTKSFIKDSLRRIGGIISDDRIMETYIKAKADGTATVAAGFKRGAMRFDFNLLRNPPPFFVEIPRPVLSSFAPVFLVRNNDE